MRPSLEPSTSQRKRHASSGQRDGGSSWRCTAPLTATGRQLFPAPRLSQLSERRQLATELTTALVEFDLDWYVSYWKGVFESVYAVDNRTRRKIEAAAASLS